MGLSPMGMMGAGMAFGALSGGLQSYVGGVQQNAAFTVQSANAQLQGAQTEIAAAQALVQAEDARYQATMSDVQARQTEADRDVARVNYTVQLSQIAKARAAQSTKYRTAQADTRARMGAANVDSSSGSALSVLTGNAAQYGAAMAESSVQRALADYGYGLTDTKLKTQALMQRNQADYLRKTGSFYDRTYGYTMRQAGYYYQMSGLYSSMKTGTAGLILNALGRRVWEPCREALCLAASTLFPEAAPLQARPNPGPLSKTSRRKQVRGQRHPDWGLPVLVASPTAFSRHTGDRI